MVDFGMPSFLFTWNLLHYSYLHIEYVPTKKNISPPAKTEMVVKLWTLSFNSNLPSKESNLLDDFDLTQKAQGFVRKQNAVAMDAMVQSMSDTVYFDCIL